MRFAEELLLLLFDDEHGDLTGTLPPGRLDILMAGSVLMDLAHENRIDTDLVRLMLVDPAPVGDDLLDPTLADIAQSADEHDIDYWVKSQAARGDDIRKRALARLAEAGILEESDDEFGGFFLSRSVSRTRRYHSGADGAAQEEVRLRVMRVLFSDEVPDPRDAVIIGLADASGVFQHLLSREERERVADRIDLLTRLDLIGQAVGRAVRRTEAETPPKPAARPASEIPAAGGFFHLLGNTLHMARNAGDFLLREHRRLGPIFRVSLPGRRFIVIAGPEANHLLARGNAHFRTFEIWRNFDADLGAMRQLSSMGGAEHARWRKHQARVYSRGILKEGLSEALRVIRKEVAEWPDDKPIPVQYAFQRILLNQLGVLSANRPAGPYLDDIIRYLSMVIRVALHGSRPKLALRLPRVRRARRRVMELAARILEEHDPARRTGRPPDYVDETLALHRADPKFLPETDLPIAVLGPFLVGGDTVSSIAGCMVYELLRHPDLLEQATAEADALFSNGIPDLGDLRPSRIDILHRVAMETMRVYPLGPAVLRVVANSFDFAGYRVPAGARVLIGMSLPHRMEEHYPDPGRFDIDRYTSERAEHRKPGVYAPFGAGEHSCLGRGLAEALLILNTAFILHETELALHPPGYRLKMKQAPSGQPSSSFKIRVKSRRSTGRTT